MKYRRSALETREWFRSHLLKIGFNEGDADFQAIMHAHDKYEAEQPPRPEPTKCSQCSWLAFPFPSCMSPDCPLKNRTT